MCLKHSFKCFLLLEFAICKWLLSETKVPFVVYYKVTPIYFSNKSFFDKFYIIFISISIPFIIINILILIYKGLS